MTTSRFDPTIHSQAELAEAWHTLMGPWSFSGHSVWMMLIVDDRPIPQLTEIMDCRDLPNPQRLEGFTEVLRSLADEMGRGTRVAFLCSRPGGASITERDRRWADVLYRCARTAGVACETVHLATQGAVRPLPLDELGARS